MALGLAPVSAAEPSPEAGDVAVRIPGGYLPPATILAAPPLTLKPSSASYGAASVGSSIGVAVGAVQVSSLGREEPGTIDSPPEPSTGDRTPPPVPASPFAAPRPPVRDAPATTPAPSGAGPDAPAQAADESGRKETVAELAAFGLVAGGAVIGIAGLFLPWANSDGFGIGNSYLKLQANQWGLGMPSSIFLLLLSGLVLGAASGSDRAKERLPALGPVIGQVTDLIMPMILGGVYLGVFLLYLTLPDGFGMGVLTMLLGGALLIAGAVVTLFFPPEAAPDVP
jgi:hypothetical protein